MRNNVDKLHMMVMIKISDKLHMMAMIKISDKLHMMIMIKISDKLHKISDKNNQGSRVWPPPSTHKYTLTSLPQPLSHSHT